MGRGLRRPEIPHSALSFSAYFSNRPAAQSRPRER